MDVEDGWTGRWTRALLIGLPLLGLALALRGCESWPQPLLRLALTDWPGYEYFYLAQELGLDRAQGLRLRAVQHSSLEDQRFSYERGDVEAIATTSSEAVAICQEAPPRCPQLVLVLDESIGADQLIAGRAIARLGGLRGRRVGLERSVLGEYLLLRALASAGLALGDVRLVYDGPHGLIDRLQQGRLEAVVTYPPYSDGLAGDPRFHALYSSRRLPRQIVDVLAVSPRLARERPRQVQALVATWWAARQEAAQRPARARELIARRQGVSPEEFRRSELLVHYVGPERQARWLAPGGWLESGVRTMARRLQASGRLDPAMPLPQVNPRWVGVEAGR